MLRLQDYEHFAKKIGNTFVCSNGEESINSLAIKLASDMTLNPEEIRTVVRIANVVSFEKLFEKKAQEKQLDRMVTFELGDPEVVISTLIEQEKNKAKLASYNSSSYDLTFDLYSDIKHNNINSEIEKTAATKELKLHPILVTHKYKLAAAKMREQKQQEELTWTLALEKAAQCVKVDLVTNKERSEFEKNAIACLGSDYHTELTAINMMTSPDNKVTNIFGGEKIAKILNNYVGENKPKYSRIFKFIKQAYDARMKYNLLANSIIKIEQTA